MDLSWLAEAGDQELSEEEAARRKVEDSSEERKKAVAGLRRIVREAHGKFNFSSEELQAVISLETPVSAIGTDPSTAPPSGEVWDEVRLTVEATELWKQDGATVASVSDVLKQHCSDSIVRARASSAGKKAAGK